VAISGHQSFLSRVVRGVSCHERAITSSYKSAAARRPWGNVRKLRSGRFQARYCVGLTWHTGPTTFRTKREADAYLASVRTEVDRGAWIDPEARMIPLARYAERWMAQRPQLRPRTRELYEGQLRLRRSRRVWSRDDIGAEDVGVDDDQAPSGEVAHASSAARKAAHSSSVRSSITMSS
jgi:hypothetical protein